MAHNQFDTARIDTLKLNVINGINLNSVRGAHNYEAKSSLQPESIVNLTNIRRRGLKPSGEPVDINLDLVGSIIGDDQFGVMSLEASGLYYIFDSVSQPVAQTEAPYASLDNTTHIPNVGAYKNRSQFLILDKDDNIVEPFTYGVSSAQDQNTAPLDETIDGVSLTQNGMEYFALTDEWWLFGDGGAMYYSDDDRVTWNDVSIGGGVNINAMATDGTYYVAVCDTKVIYISDDTGTTWTTYNPTLSGAIVPDWKSVIFDGTRFIAVGSIGAIVTFTDGTTFTQQNPQGLDDFTDIIFSNSTYYISESGEGSEQRFRRATTATFPTFTLIGSGRQAKMNAMATNGSIWVAVGTGESGTAPKIFVSQDATTWITYDENILDDRNATFVPADVDYINGYFVMAGSGNAIYKSANGTAWERVTSPIAGDWVSVTIGDDNNFYVLNSATDAYAIVEGTSALVSGKYQVVLIPHIITKAGKLVLDIIENTYTILDTGGYVDIAVDADADPNHANFRVDVYVKLAQFTFVEGVVTDVEDLADQDLIYIDTLEQAETLKFDTFPESATFVLGTRGAIGICAFGGNQVCNYNANIWGKLSEDEADFKFLDPELSVSEITAPFTAAFTESGYVNLFTVNNTVPLGSNQSDDITGCAVISQGLLIFTNNETFLVSGNPDTQLSVNIYPDIVGLDSGKKAINFGGMAIGIWQGRIYIFTEGKAQDISKEVYLPEDKFVQLAVESETRSLIARTQSNNVYKLDVDDEGYWTNNPIPEADYLIQKKDVVYYVDDTDNVIELQATGVGVHVPTIVWRKLDQANPYRRDRIKAISIPVEEYTYTSGNPPRCYFNMDGQFDDVSLATAKYVDGYYADNQIFFNFPSGYKGKQWDLRVVFNNASLNTIISGAWEIRSVLSEQAFE